MAVNPVTPNGQSEPWEPTVTTGKGSGDESTAANQYTGIYGGTYQTGTGSGSSGAAPTAVPVPTLAMAYTAAPDFIPVPGGGTAAQTPSGGMVDDLISVDLGALRATEQGILSATSEIVEEYQNLTVTVNDLTTYGDTFGQYVGTLQKTNPDNKAGSMQATTVIYDDLDTEAQQFATDITAEMTQVLQAIGNTIEVIGQFTALLNAAGQMYTETDYLSAFTDPPS
jgi:hypothetical protein